MQQTKPFLMFSGPQYGRAEEAITLYTSLLPNSRISHITRWPAGQPGGREGTVMTALFTLAGTTYMASDSAGDHAFNFTPSISIFVDCTSPEEQEHLLAALGEGGVELMPLGDYGFSRRFAWVQDRFGVSWQINLP